MNINNTRTHRKGCSCRCSSDSYVKLYSTREQKIGQSSQFKSCYWSNISFGIVVDMLSPATVTQCSTIACIVLYYALRNCTFSGTSAAYKTKEKVTVNHSAQRVLLRWNDTAVSHLT
eukprot:18154-Heterococcus_DN1.PRE.4